MAATNNFKNWMAAKLGAVLRREITPDEITLGPVFQASGAKKALIEVNYDGEKYPIVYDKFPISEMFGGSESCPVVIPGTPTTYVDALKLINARLGLNISETDVYPFNVSSSILTMMLEFTPTCYEYTGKLNIQLEWTGDFELPKPLHEWLLQDNLLDTGESPVALTGPITHFTNEAGKWGSLGGTAHIPFPAGAQLARPGDYTLDFEVYFDAIRSYSCLLTTNGAGAGVTGSIWWYGGKCYEYGVSSGTAAIPVAKAKTPHRVTFVRKADKTSMYIDGVFVQTYTSTTTLPFVGFRDADSTSYQFQPTDGLRNLRFWGRGLSSGELRELFKKPPVNVPQPLHMFALDGDTANSGTATDPMTMGFTYESEYGRIWAVRTKGGGELLGPNVKFEFNHDAVLDFEVMLVPGSDYREIFSTDPNALNATGAFMMYANKIYHAGIGYAGLPDIMARQSLSNRVPVRITQRLKSGVMYVYVNGLLYMSYPFTLAKPYISIGDTDSTTNHMAAPNRIRAISYWPSALTDAEFDEMLKVASASYPKPTHQFLLDGDSENSGKSKLPLSLPVNYEQIGIKKYAVRKNTAAEPLGVTFNLSGDYVLDFVLYPSGTGANNILFASSKGGPQSVSVGSIQVGNDLRLAYAHISDIGKPYPSLPAMPNAAPTRYTFRRRGTEIVMYQNGVETTRFVPTQTIEDYDTFGNGTFSDWRAPNKFRAIRFWEGTVTDEEFVAIMANNI